LPLTGDEKKLFKQRISSLRDLHKGADLENVDEAMAAAYRAWTPTKIPESVKALMNDAKASFLNAQVRVSNLL
jgi:amyloid beta precursor protein binding protein 1